MHLFTSIQTNMHSGPGRTRILALLIYGAILAGCWDPIRVISAMPDDSQGPNESPTTPDSQGHDVVPWYPPQGEAEIESLGTSRSMLLRGFVVTPDKAFPGEILIRGSLIACVGTSCTSEPEADQANVVETNGLIFPGMLNAVNHTLYGIFDPSAGPLQTFKNKSEWLEDERIQLAQSIKKYLNNEADFPNPADPDHPTPKVTLGCELEKFGELKGLIAGTTSVVTSATPTNQKCLGSLARTIDQATNGLLSDKMQTCSTGKIPDQICDNIEDDDTNRFLFHAGEGRQGFGDDLFHLLAMVPNPKNNNYCTLFSPETVIVHGTSFESTEFSIMKQAGMKLVWTPQSDYRLYGETTNIPLALSNQIPVALATDWALTGSQNLLDELRFAMNYINTHWPELQITDKRLVQMVTKEAALVLGVETMLGTLEKGKKADIVVIGGDRNKPYHSLIHATPASVRLTIVNGIPLYGDSHLLPLAPQDPECEALDVCGSQSWPAKKFICVASTHNDLLKMNQTLSDIRSALANDPIVSSHIQLAPLAVCE